jgi:hypothetical protein
MQLVLEQHEFNITIRLTFLVHKIFGLINATNDVLV